MTDPRRQGLPNETVVCVGSSTTASRGTYKWIDELEKRPHNKRFRFVNLGVGVICRSTPSGCSIE
jgi:hypothetical protein